MENKGEKLPTSYEVAKEKADKVEAKPDKRKEALGKELEDYQNHLKEAKTEKEKEELMEDIRRIEKEVGSLDGEKKEDSEEEESFEEEDEDNIEKLKEEYKKLEEEAKKTEGVRARSVEEIEEEMERVEKEIKGEERGREISSLKEEYKKLEEEAKKTEGVRLRSIEDIEEEMARLEKKIKEVERGGEEDIEIELGPEREVVENPLLVSWRERIYEASKLVEPLYVTVKRSSGEMEDGWIAEMVENGRIRVFKYNREGERVVKRVKPEDLTEWNKEKPKEKGKEKEKKDEKKANIFVAGIIVAYRLGEKVFSAAWEGIKSWAGVKEPKSKEK